MSTSRSSTCTVSAKPGPRVTPIGAVLVTMGLALTRAWLGPTVFDRILALNMFGTKTVLLIAVMGFFKVLPLLALVFVLFFHAHLPRRQIISVLGLPVGVVGLGFRL